MGRCPKPRRYSGRSPLPLPHCVAVGVAVHAFGWRWGSGLPHKCQLKTLDSVQTWKLLKKFHQNFITGIYFLSRYPNIKVFVKLFSKSLQGCGDSVPTVLRQRRTESCGFFLKLALMVVCPKPRLLPLFCGKVLHMSIITYTNGHVNCLHSNMPKCMYM